MHGRFDRRLRFRLLFTLVAWLIAFVLVMVLLTVLGEELESLPLALRALVLSPFESRDGQPIRRAGGACATGLTSGAAELIHAAYLAMDLLVSTLLALALGALLTGVLLGLGTRWRLTRYHRVLTKLALAIVLATAAVFSLRPSLDEAAAKGRQPVPQQHHPLPGAEAGRLLQPPMRRSVL